MKFLLFLLFLLFLKEIFFFHPYLQMVWRKKIYLISELNLGKESKNPFGHSKSCVVG